MILLFKGAKMDFDFGITAYFIFFAAAFAAGFVDAVAGGIDGLGNTHGLMVRGRGFRGSIRGVSGLAGACPVAH